ncbi:hypothetical protein BaRGS_00016459, partial [Batillaria attramentaria]
MAKMATAINWSVKLSVSCEVPLLYASLPTDLELQTAPCWPRVEVLHIPLRFFAVEDLGGRPGSFRVTVGGMSRDEGCSASYWSEDVHRQWVTRSSDGGQIGLQRTLLSEAGDSMRCVMQLAPLATPSAPFRPFSFPQLRWNSPWGHNCHAPGIVTEQCRLGRENRSERPPA